MRNQKCYLYDNRENDQKRILGISKLFSFGFSFLFFINFSGYSQNCSVNAGIDISVCANAPLAFSGGKTGSFQGAGVINWAQVAGPSAVITTPSSLTSSVTSVLGGNTYKFRLSATCADGSTAIDEVNVIVNPINLANAGPDQTVCPGTNVTTLAATPAGGNWTVISTNYGITVNNTSSPTSTITALPEGYYYGYQYGGTTLRYTTITGSCTSTDDVVIYNKGGALPVSAGTDITTGACYSSTQSTSLYGSYGGGYGGQTGVWSVVSGPNIPTINNSSYLYGRSASGLIQGTYIFRFTVSGSCVNGSDDMQVIVPAPGGNITFPNITAPVTTYGTANFCDGRTSTVLTANQTLNPNETLVWSKASGAAGDVIATPTSNSTLVTNLNTTTTYRYVCTITNSVTGCSNSSYIWISWSAPPSLTLTTSSPIILSCGTSVASISYTTGGTGTPQYRFVSTPLSSTPSGWSNLGVSPANISGFSTPGTYQMQLQQSAGAGSSCNTVFQDFTVTVATPATLANAGSDQRLACNVFSTSIVGNIPTAGTGKWTQISGPNAATISSPTSNNCPISGLISGKYTFRWLISSGNSCPSNQDDVDVYVANPTPTASAAGSDINICNSAPYTLTGNAPLLNEIGTWTASPSAGITFSNANSPNATVNGMAPSTTYTFTWIISNNCGSSSDNVMVTTNATAGPIASLAGADQCLPSGTTSVTLAANAPAPGTGQWTKILGGDAIITNATLNTSTVTGMTNGTYLFEWAITRNACTITRDTVTITISAAGTIAAAGTDQSVCGTTASLAGNTPTIGTGYWTQVSGNGGAVITDPTSPTSGVTGLSVGAFVFRWTISNGACSSNFDDVQLNVSLAPTVAYAGIDQSVCIGSSTILAANTITSGTGIWSVISGPSTPSFSNTNLPTATISGLTNGSYILRWKSYSGAYCAPSTDDVVIDVTQAVTTASLGGNVSLCNATETILTGNISTIGTWTQDPGGPNTATLSVTSPSSATASGLIPGVYTFRYTYTTATSCSNTAIKTVTIYGMPNQANAGADQNVCDAASIIMTGNAATLGAGAWTKISGPAATITTSALATTTITALTSGTYVFQWQITNGTCSTRDEMIVVSGLNASIANAGADQNAVCGSVATMAGNSPTPGVGTWSQISGPNTATITSTILPNTTITGLIAGTYVFRWTTSNGACPITSDDVSITVFAAPTTATAGPDQNLCGAVSATLAGNTIVSGAGQWTQVSGPNTAAITLDSDPTTTITGLISGTYVMRWTSTSGGCSTFDDVSIIITTAPTAAAAGDDQSICLYSALNLAGNTPAIGTGTWTQISGATAIIQNANSPTSSITGTSVGTYGFRWTITNGTCPTSTDDVLVTINDLPSLALAGADQNLCNVTTTTMAAIAATVGTGTWSLVSGPNTPTITNTNLATTTITSLVPGTYIFDWTIASGPCTSSDQIQVTIGGTPTTSDAGPDQIVCSSTIVTMGGNVPTTGTGAWSRVSGPNTPTITTPGSNATTITGLIAGTYIYRWTISSSPCTASTDDVQITVLVPSAPTVSSIVQPTCAVTTGTIVFSTQSNVEYGVDGVYQASSNFSGLGAGSKTLTVRSTVDNTCIATAVPITTINAAPTTPATPTVSGTTQPTCAVPTGLIVFDTQADVQYAVNGSYQAGTSFSGLSAGIKTLTVRSIADNSCITTAASTITINDVPIAPAVPSVSVTTQPTCAVPSGTIVFNTQANVEYAINGSYQSGETFSNLTTGAKTLTVRSSSDNTCITPATSTVTIDAIPTAPSVPSALSITQPTCGVPMGSIEFNTQAGVEYAIDGNYQASATFTGLSIGNKVLSVRKIADNTCITSGGSTVDLTSPICTDLSVANAIDNNTPNIGSNVIFTITATNNGPSNATGVQVTDQIPSGYTYISDNGGGNYVSATGIWTIGALLNVASSVLNITVTVNDLGIYNNIAGVTGSQTDLDLSNNSASKSSIPNHYPVAIPDAYTVNKGSTLTVNAALGLLNNDTDADGNTLTSILVTSVSNGSLTLNSDGSFTYTHNGSETTSDQFTYKANDGTADGNSVTVTIAINPVNDAPVASAVTAITQTGFSADWTASTGATGYYIDVATDNAFTTFVTGFNNQNVANVVTYAITGLTANTTYYYRVRAYNTDGTSLSSSTIAVTTLPNIPDTPVASAATNVTKTSFSANWVASARATGYYLDVATDNAFTAFVNGFDNKDVADVTTFSVTGLAAATTYYYRVRAYNTGGTNASSDTISVLSVGTSISDNTAEPLKIFVNNGKVNISSAVLINDVRVTDINGKLVAGKNINATNAVISTEGWSPGIYIFTIKTQNDIVTKKLSFLK